MNVLLPPLSHIGLSPNVSFRLRKMFGPNSCCPAVPRPPARTSMGVTKCNVSNQMDDEISPSGAVSSTCADATYPEFIILFDGAEMYPL